ncbi:hypothetical protein R5R35_002069 [Gryllus longicercus]|uniref:Uncharacterized protein n=1 Tax=Gryllus longicercus TaxID=2509291 RepID=A0AAN9VIV1_9ORTH|nr:Down syndrome cell adhesion molecule-like protein Dscam2 [Gryllus bimaculatus]
MANSERTTVLIHHPISNMQMMVEECPLPLQNNIGNGRMLRKLPTAETAFVLGQKLEPPSGFSDGHELSEAECDIDSVKKLRIGIMKNSLNIFGPSSGNQDFTIAV